MDPREIQEKVEGFTHKLLAEAHGDPVRALGLLVLVLEGWDTQESEQITQILGAVRHILFPDSVVRYRGKGIQHIAGPQSWEGFRHCVRCGVVLAKGKIDALDGLSSSHVYQVGNTYQVDPPEEFDSCQSSS